MLEYISLNFRSKDTNLIMESKNVWELLKVLDKLFTIYGIDDISYSLIENYTDGTSVTILDYAG